MAPEVAQNRPYNEKVDMYSYAIILYEIITGNPAFDGFSRTQFYTEVVYSELRPSLDDDEYGRPITVHPAVAAIISTCWDPVAAKRLSAESVLKVLYQVESSKGKSQKSNGFSSIPW